MAHFVGTVNGKKYYQFAWAHDITKCLDGGQIRQFMAFPCNGGPYQMWYWN